MGVCSPQVRRACGEEKGGDGKGACVFHRGHHRKSNYNPLVTTVFISGSTGYLGRPLAETLAARGHEVHVLVRPGAQPRAPRGCRPVPGDALRPETYLRSVPAGCVFVQLVGTPHPSPLKAASFQAVDRPAGLGSVRAAQAAGVSHFVYLSVAQPAPIMRAYIEVRAEVESAIAAAGLSATLLRPWYVVGPGHRWAMALAPFYALMELFPPTREGARRLGLVSHGQMQFALLNAIEHPAPGVRVWDVAKIRTGGI